MLLLACVSEPPKSVQGTKFTEGELSGALLPWANGTPIYVPSSSYLGQYYLPCFTDIDALRIFMLKVQIFEYEVKRIDVGGEFLKSFEGSNIKVVLDPAQLPDGRIEIGEFHLPGSDKWKLSKC